MDQSDRQDVQKPMILCLGDSVTRGVSYVRDKWRLISPTYPEWLETILQTQHVDVINKGRFNATSSDVLRRIDKDIAPQPAQLVLLEIGANDSDMPWGEVAAQPEEDFQPRVPLDQFVQNMQQIIDQLQQLGKRVVLLSLPPIDPRRYYEFLAKKYSRAIAHWIGRCGGIFWWQEQYNQALKDLAEERRTPWVDIRHLASQTLPLEQLLSEDGIHPTPAGYHALAQFIGQALMFHRLLPETNGLSCEG
ncbi:MAG: GDSL-type esterase/lipase family protein [Firmicutes bacterium]|nr:GDSL-type esterase/lipase family protein [Bacillota bacterium]